MAYADFTAPWFRPCLVFGTEIVFLNSLGVLAIPHHRNLRSHEVSRRALFILSAFYEFEPVLRPILQRYIVH